MANPSVFVGSSEEGLHIARAIGHSLRNDAEVTIWDEGVFAPGQGFLEAIVNAVERFDFAILVLTPDDLIDSRTLTALVPRDNVMFELGLFMGRLGRSRTFVVASDDEDMKIPSDFAGVTMLTFQSHRDDDNILASVSSACFQIRQAMQSLGFSETRSMNKLQEATLGVEGVSEKLMQLVRLMAQSRILELDVIRTQMGHLLPSDFLDKLIEDLKRLEEATESQEDTESSKL